MAVTYANVELRAEVGHAVMPLRALLGLGRGAVLTIETQQASDVAIHAGGRQIAAGSILVQDGQLFAEILGQPMPAARP